MRILDNMDACYGCGACCNVCPTEAITMKINLEGFLEPFIDERKCISCGKCKKVCPSFNCEYPNDSEPDIYAFSAEDKILYDSSSGGVFTFLAEHILKSEGHVVGAAYDPEFYVNHVIIHNSDELDKIRRSKYLQSSTGDTYKKQKFFWKRERLFYIAAVPAKLQDYCVFWEKIMIICTRWIYYAMAFLPPGCFRSI